MSGDNYKRASWHICKLLAKEEGTFFSDLESLEDCFSYREWMEILNKIASNRYWSQVPPEDRCVHNVSASQEAPSKPKSEKIETKFSLSKLSDYGKAKKKPTKVEELILLSSGESSTSDEFSEESSSDESITGSSRAKARYRGSYRRKYDIEVVEPPKFAMDGQMPLEE